MSSFAYPNPQAVFQQQYESVRRDEVVGVLLALFLGGFGVHHFYLRRTGLGILYLVFSWTPIPWVLGFLECFFMPGRVREFNAIEAAHLAVAMGVAVPGYVSYPGWVAPGWGSSGWGSSGWATPGFAPAATASVPTTGVGQGTLTACGHCRQVNSAGAHFCGGCGSQLG